MPFTFTAAHSSRITKRRAKKAPSFDRRGSSLAETARRAATLSPTAQAATAAARQDDDSQDDFDSEERLGDKGLIQTLGTDLLLQNVVPTINHIRANMFDEIPERSGMNSTRKAEVLNTRRAMPPIVTNSHVHALIKSPTIVEKEISQLVRASLVKRVTVPGRGRGLSSLSDCVVLVSDWKALLDGMSEIPTSLKETYMAALRGPSNQFNPDIYEDLSDDAVNVLMKAGLLTTSSSALRFSTTKPISSKDGSTGTMTSIDSISRAGSGSVNAVGGKGAVLASGGGGAIGLVADNRGSGDRSEISVSLPNTGTFLRLIHGARSHLLYILSKSRHGEAPLYMLRERWDGNINAKAPRGRSRDPFATALPSKIKKWKEFYGLKFDYVLAECFGAGLVEIFETGSVGLGVRLV